MHISFNKIEKVNLYESCYRKRKETFIFPSRQVSNKLKSSLTKHKIINASKCNKILQLSCHHLSSSFLSLSDLVFKVSAFQDPLLHSMDYK